MQCTVSRTECSDIRHWLSRRAELIDDPLLILSRLESPDAATVLSYCLKPARIAQNPQQLLAGCLLLLLKYPVFKSLAGYISVHVTVVPKGCPQLGAGPCLSASDRNLPEGKDTEEAGVGAVEGARLRLAAAGARLCGPGATVGAALGVGSRAGSTGSTGSLDGWAAGACRGAAAGFGDCRRKSCVTAASHRG